MGDDFYYSLINYEKYLKDKIDHHSEEMADIELATFETVRNKLHEIIYEQTGISDIVGFVQ